VASAMPMAATYIASPQGQQQVHQVVKMQKNIWTWLLIIGAAFICIIIIIRLVKQGFETIRDKLNPFKLLGL